MRIILAVLAALFVVSAVPTAEAGGRCDPTIQSCRTDVQRQVGDQDRAVRGGPQWGPVSYAACQIASREQEGNERRCRSYDVRSASGKSREECAKCCRQVREDFARWQQCHQAGFAPSPPQAIRASLARLCG